jgi:hypothetical protein
MYYLGNAKFTPFKSRETDIKPGEMAGNTSFTKEKNKNSQKPERHSCCSRFFAQSMERVKSNVGFEASTAVVLKSSIFWHTTPSSSLKVSHRFGGTFRHHHQEQIYLLQAGFLLGLVFGPENGGDVLRNVGCLSMDYMVLYLNR